MPNIALNIENILLFLKTKEIFKLQKEISGIHERMEQGKGREMTSLAGVVFHHKCPGIIWRKQMRLLNSFRIRPMSLSALVLEGTASERKLW